MQPLPNEQIKLNEILVDFSALQIELNGQKHPIEAKQMALLKLLVEYQGEAVTRTQIMDRVWPDVIVSDNSVSQAVTQLRKALADPQDQPKFIRTIPRKGYQLIAKVEPVAAAEPLNWTKIKAALISACLGGIAVGSLASYGWYQWHQDKPFHYQRQITASPGQKQHISHSHQGQYLVFSQQVAQGKQHDILLHDPASQQLHTLKKTGYDEVSPALNEQGTGLVYIRQSAFDCQLRQLALSGPIETWHLNRDRQIADCQISAKHNKIHWRKNQLWWLNPELHLLQQFQFSDKQQGLTDKPIATINNVIEYAIDDDNQHILTIEQNNQGYAIFYRQYNQQLSSATLVEKIDPPFTGLQWITPGETFWLGGNQLVSMNLAGHSQAIPSQPTFVYDFALHPNQSSLMLVEGNLQSNIYQLDHGDNDSFQLTAITASNQVEYLPVISDDGQQIAYISEQIDHISGETIREIWLKHKRKSAANLLTRLPLDLTPKQMIWSPNQHYLLVQDQQQKSYLVSVFTGVYKPILQNFSASFDLYWQQNDHLLFFSALHHNSQIHGQLDLQQQQIETSSEPAWQALDLSVTANATFNQYLTWLAKQISANNDTFSQSELEAEFQQFKPTHSATAIYFAIKEAGTWQLLRFDRQTHQINLLSELASAAKSFGIRYSMSVSRNDKVVIAMILQRDNNLILRKQVN